MRAAQSLLAGGARGAPAGCGSCGRAVLAPGPPPALARELSLALGAGGK